MTFFIIDLNERNIRDCIFIVVIYGVIGGIVGGIIGTNMGLHYGKYVNTIKKETNMKIIK